MPSEETKPVCDIAKLAGLSAPERIPEGSLFAYEARVQNHTHTLETLEAACKARLPVSLQHRLWSRYVPTKTQPGSRRAVFKDEAPDALRAAYVVEGARLCGVSAAEFGHVTGPGRFETPARLTRSQPPEPGKLTVQQHNLDVFKRCGLARLELLSEAQLQALKTPLALSAWMTLVWMRENGVPQTNLDAFWRALKQRVPPHHARERLVHGAPEFDSERFEDHFLVSALSEAKRVEFEGEEVRLVDGPWFDKANLDRKTGALVPLLDALRAGLKRQRQLAEVTGKPLDPQRAWVRLELPPKLASKAFMTLLATLKEAKTVGLVAVYDRAYTPAQPSSALGYTRVELSDAFTRDVIRFHLGPEGAEIATYTCAERDDSGACPAGGWARSEARSIARGAGPSAVSSALSEVLAAREGLGVVVSAAPDVPLARLIDAQAIAARAVPGADAAMPKDAVAFWRALATREITRDVRFNADPPPAVSTSPVPSTTPTPPQEP